MSEIEIGRGVRQGCPLSPTLFNIYLEDLVKNCFQSMRGVIVGGRIIKCIRFADMALLAEEEMMLKDMLLELNDSLGYKEVQFLKMDVFLIRETSPAAGYRRVGDQRHLLGTDRHLVPRDAYTRKNDTEIDQEEENKLVVSLAEKKLPTEGCTGRNGKREKSSGQKKISDDRRH
ncbi:hypothetical protein ANN_11724 [Periplaneta americana]|uniref:Reverse transcriptase domain-containing protein n=1 Tax=Periplaneta americana TaxID=6978 RepID=A0ABQ8T5V7_PERAM|nr:hypothetical protein ANN_11724 [Periplaneta americana]